MLECPPFNASKLPRAAFATAVRPGPPRRDCTGSGPHPAAMIVRPAPDHGPDAARTEGGPMRANPSR